MRIHRKFKVSAFCVIIISILFANISNASQSLKLESSWSSQIAKELIIGLKGTNIRQEGDKIKADVVLWNNTLTWAYVEQDFTTSKKGQFPVQTEGAYLLGPLYTKNLGTKEFSKGSFLHFNAKTAKGIGHLLGRPEGNMLLGALAIDMAMRGFFTRELPPNAFDRPLVLPIEVGMASIDPLFFTITSHCSGALAVFSKSVVMKDTDGALNALGRFLLCTTEAPVKEKVKEWLIKLFSKEMAEKWAKKFVGSIGDFLNLPMKATLMKILTEYTLNATPESWARIEAVEVKTDAQLQITRSLSITPKKDKYQVGNILSGEFTITNKGNAPVTFDVLTVGGRLNGECPQDKCPDFEWNTKVPPLKPGDSYSYKGKLKLEAPGSYHFFTAYRTKDGWNTAIPTVPGVTNTKDIVVKPLTEEPIVKDWKEYKLGALSFSVPSNWHVVKTENSFVGGSTEGDVSFMVTVGTCESVKDVEQGKVRIVHFGSSGGQIEEPGTTSRTISITHMGRLLNSFKTGVSGRQVTVCILRLTENEGMISEEEGFTNWSFALIEGGRLYAFSVAGRDSAFRDAMFKQLVSKIHLLSQFTTKTDEPYKDLQRWLFGDALNVKLTAKWNEKNCKIWGPEMKPLLWDCRHTGIDFGAPEGTTVYSATDGAVIRVEHGKDCQRLECLSTVAIYNDSTHVTFIYLHMKDIKVGLGKVKAGKQIGVVGQRGPATGPHLHLEVRSGKKTRAAIDVRNTEDPYEAAKKAREAINILGTYIIKDAKDRRFLELRRDNTYLLGFFGKWSIHPELYEVLGGFPSEPHEALVPVSTRICRKLFLSSYAHDKDELYVEIRGKAFPVSESVEEGFIDTQGKVITNPSFVRETGSKLIKSARGTLWNKYLNHKGDFLEFYEDGSYMRSLEAGMWTIKGDFIKFCPKPHPGVPHYERNYCSRGKLKDNTIVLIDGLTSLRRGTIITKQ